MTDGGHVHHTADWRREGGNQGGSQYLSTQWDAVAAAVVCALTTCYGLSHRLREFLFLLPAVQTAKDVCVSLLHRKCYSQNLWDK